MKEPIDHLDQLLAQAPPPPAPPWFEQRLMARLRREEENRRPFWARPGLLFRMPVLAGALAIALTAIVTWRISQPAESTPNLMADDEIHQGLDAFVAYQEQSRSWNVEW
ncbi:MAG: hypothetical protein SFU85_11240 [Candidatus Methylacidiphilales bacterium]|nr:hypothetical protein [Candidatus Methylacidiphilales bacterium]